MSGTSLTLVNGQLRDCIGLYDRALSYGDGIFETLLAVNGQLQCWDLHCERLVASLQRLSISAIDTDQLKQWILENLSGHGQQVIKIIISRGTGQRGYSSVGIHQPNQIIFITDYDSTTRAGSARIGFCQIRLATQPALAGIKHLNRLEQVLARQEVDQRGLDEGLLCGQHDNVIEAVQHNVFAVKNEVLYTPDLSVCGVNGIMRQRVMALAGQCGLPVQIQTLDREFIEQADELFLTNSLSGIWPICELEGNRFEMNRVTYLLRDAINGIIASD